MSVKVTAKSDFIPAVQSVYTMSTSNALLLSSYVDVVAVLSQFTLTCERCWSECRCVLCCLQCNAGLAVDKDKCLYVGGGYVSDLCTIFYQVSVFIVTVEMSSLLRHPSHWSRYLDCRALFLSCNLSAS